MKTAIIDITTRCINIYRWLMWLVFLFEAAPLLAQNNEAGDSIRINPKFMEELDRAFSFAPIEAPIAAPDDVLTREQLHEWVGPVDDVPEGRQERMYANPGRKYGYQTKKYDPTDPNRFDSTYFALKMYLVEFCKLQPVVKEIKIPGLENFTDGLQHYGNHLQSTKTGGIATNFDANALAKYIRPTQIRLRKSRDLAEKARPLMDKIFPLEGEPIYSITDTIRANNR